MGPVSLAVGSMSTSPLVKTPGWISRPSVPARTFPCSTSALARAYSEIEPTSVEYPRARLCHDQSDARPIPARDVTEQRLAVGQQLREQVFAEIEGVADLVALHHA